MSTFGAFTTARLGIYASQKALDVVGNNIANINTQGYTRQQVDQVSLITGHADRYHTMLDNRVGCGALVTGISQLRDPYLDIRYRTEMSTVGYMSEKSSGLAQLSNILDEVAKGENANGELGVVEKQFNDLIEQMQALADRGAGQDSFDTNVRTSASSLTKLFNSYASRLEQLYENQRKGFMEDIGKVNDILSNIRELNNTIRKSNIYGGDALEQKDARNLLIDELSEYMRIDVTYEIEDMGGGFEVEKLVIKLAGNDPYHPETNNTTLIDGIYGAQLSVDEASGNYDVTVGPLKDRFNRVQTWRENGADVRSEPVHLTDNALYGSLQAQRELLTEQGEYSTEDQLAVDPKANTKRGILYYMKSLDTLANQFAYIMNGANQYEREVDLKTATVADEMKANDTFVDPNTGEKYKLNVLNVDGEYYLDATSACSLPTQRFGMSVGEQWEQIQNGTSTMDITTFKNSIQALKVGASGILTDDQKLHLVNGAGCSVRVDPADFAPVIVDNVLFSNSGNNDNPTGITAANISISKGWSEGSTRIIQSKDPDHPSKDNTNLNHMLYLLQEAEHDFTPDGADLHMGSAANGTMFTGTFQEMFTENICGNLAADRASTGDLLENHAISADELYVDRDAVSGVDLNDEAMNMMQFQKSLNAAYRLMTVIDETLEKLINGTGIAGR